MGYTADADWTVTFKSEGDLMQAAQELIREDDEDQTFVGSIEGARELIANMLGACQEHEALDWDADDPLTLRGWTSGRLYDETDEYQGAIAPYCTGIVDWRGEDGNFWRDRFNGEIVATYGGKIVYPEDPLEEE